MIRVAIVDDKINNCRVIADKLSRNSFFSISFESVNGEDFLNKMSVLAEDDRPHIVLMDPKCRRQMVFLPLARPLSLYPDVKFVVLTILMMMIKYSGQ